MSRSPFIRAALLALLLAITFALPARAAGPFSGQPLSTLASPDPGVRAKAPTDAALDTTLSQLTDGLDASDVTTQSACSAAKPGQAACFAKTLVTRGAHKRIHPHVAHTNTFTQVFPTRHTGIAPATAAGSPAATAPGAGTPAWLQQAYDLTYLSQTAGTSGVVGIVDAYDDPTAEADLATYRSRYGLPACSTANGCFKKLSQSGQQSNYPSHDTGWSEEISLDLDAVSALCPNCKIVLVEANTSYSNDLATGIQAAVNAGAKQVSNSYGAGEGGVDPYFPRSIAGVSLLASTGDNGTMASGVSAYPAALPGFVAVGGTSLALSGGSPTARGFGESAWSGAGSGCNTQSTITKPTYQTDSGCTGRSYADVSAVADPNTGLIAYSTDQGGWFLVGGTSLASPLVAAYEAVTGITDATPKWAYDNSALLNDPVSGTNGSCSISYICNATTGYDGPTGIGSISGAVATGAPGVAAPSKSAGYATATSGSTATLAGGVYPNSLSTSYYVEYGTTTSYGTQSTASGIGSGKAPVLTTTTLTNLQASTTYHYRIVATNSAGTNYGYDYTFTTASAASVPPSNTIAPVISGTNQQGQTLTVSTGTWNPAASAFTYQWQRSTDGGSTWTSISGGTSTTYVPGIADLNAVLRVIVTATNTYGPGTATTVSFGPISSGAPVNTVAPVISGVTRRGQTLTVSSTWNPTGTTTYQWQHDTGSGFTTISGATAASYTLVSADLGANLRVVVTSTNAFGAASATSAGVGPVVIDPPVNSAAPAVTGTTQRTYQLTTTRGTWAGTGNAYGYQWQRSSDGSSGWMAISGATNATYTLGVADEGTWLRTVVTATNSDGTAAQTSNSTPQFIAQFPPANTVAPTISGTPQRTITLTSSRGTWTGPDNTYAYQWQRDFGEGYVNISGATAPTYTLTAADEDATVRLLVTATNPDASIVEASQPTTLVQDAGPFNQSLPTISGSVQRGASLTASPGTWLGAGNTYTYQWQTSTDGNSWTDVSGATTSNYTLGVGDEGSKLRIKVTATNADGTVSATSAATATVPSAAPVNTVAPSISGSATRGSVLTAARGTWDGIGNVYTYQWQRDGVDIAGATAVAYTLTTADVGAKLRLVVSVTNPDGTAAVAGDPTATVVSAPPVNTVAPLLTGTAQRASTLSSTQGTWTGVGNTYTYQWQSSTDGNTWTNVSGATASTYLIAVSDEGRQLRMLLTAANPDATVSVATTATTTIPSAPPVNTALPTLTGIAQRASVLSGTMGTWNGIGNNYSYQWQRDSGSGFTNISGATGVSYTLTLADEFTSVRLVLTAANPDGTVTAASAGTATVTAAAPTNSVRPAITGTAQRGSILTSSLGTWGGAGNSYVYQWQRDSGAGFVDISGATGTSYTLGVADESAKVRVQVTATNPDGSLNASSDPSATVPSAPPVNTTAPVLTGTEQRGQTLGSTTGSWNGVGNTYAYQWQRSTDAGTTWVNINGATSLTYALVTADVGAKVRMLVTVTNPDGTASQASNATGLIASAGPLNTMRPTVTGTAQRGALLTSTPGTWTGTGNVYTYQWQNSADGTTWSDIRGATGTTYTVGAGDENGPVRVLVTATNTDGANSAASNVTATVQAQPPVDTVLPAVTGTAQRSFTLSASQGTWTGAGNVYSYRWQRDSGSGFADVAGATDALYVLGVADEGAKLRVVVTATNPDASVSATSAATATVLAAAPVNTVLPAITGTAQRTAQLSASTGTWNGIGNAYSYQWQRNGVDISGATSATYTLASADVGATVRVKVTATNPDGTVTATSAATASVRTAPPVNVGVPIVSGRANLGSVLSTTSGDWTPAGPAYTYQWQRDGVDVAGATSSTYTLARADVGAAIRVTVTATNVDGSAGATSAATGAVTAPPTNAVAPAAPSGTPEQQQTLTADQGTWDQPGATFTSSWQRCPAGATAISAACSQAGVGSTYTLKVEDVGHVMIVRVTATSAGGSTGADSAATATIRQLPLVNTQLPSISGTPQIPNTLSADPGRWNQALSGYTFTWKRCDADGTSNCVAAQTGGDTYVLTGDDDGHTIVLYADVTAGGLSAGAHSPALSITQTPVPQSTIAPVITGTAARGSTLSAGPGTWTNNPTRFSYQWQRNGVDLSGATSATYVPVQADEGATLSVVVTAANAVGTGTAQSNTTAAVVAAPPVNTHRPAVTGTIAQGETVSATGYTWNATADTTYAVTWQRCDSGGCATIAGATGIQYTLVAADVGHSLVAVSIASNVDGTVSARSDASGVASMAAPRWKTLPVLSTSAGRVGDVLSITAGTWTGPVVTTDTTQMMRCTNACSSDGASNAGSYTVASGDLGAILRVRETASNVGGDTVVWSARYVGPIINAQSAAAVVGKNPTPLRNSKGQTLATATLPSAAQARASKKAKPTVAIKRASSVTGKLTAWACEAALNTTAAPKCSAKVKVSKSATLKLPAAATGKLRVVVIQK